MDGWEVAQRLRAEGHGEARIVVLSANIGDMPVPSGEETAHDEVLAKPFDLRRLYDILQAQLGLDWLDGSEPAVVSPAAAAPPVGGPTRGEVEEMLQMARIGYARGVEQTLAAVEARVEAEGGTIHPRLVELRRALADFDMGRVTSELEAFDGDA
jgi:CheY-like chemotaxis protein